MKLANRIFQTLTWVLVACALSVSAHALVRPETRVGGGAGFSSVFASPSASQVAPAHQENPGCAYDFALAVHKYLYCHDDPVNGIDPSGHENLISISSASAIIGGLATLAFSPGTANAPGPRDPTYSDSGAAALAANIGGAVVIGNLVKYAVGPALAKLWRFMKPQDRVRLLKARYAHADQYSGTAVGARVEVRAGMPEGEYLFVVDQNGRMWAVRAESGFHHNSLVPSNEGVLAAGNIKVEAGGIKVEAHGGSGHYNLKGPDGGFGSGEGKAFEDGVSELLKNLGFEVKGVKHTQFYPSDGNPFE